METAPQSNQTIPPAQVNPGQVSQVPPVVPPLSSGPEVKPKTPMVVSFLWFLVLVAVIVVGMGVVLFVAPSSIGNYNSPLSIVRRVVSRYIFRDPYITVQDQQLGEYINVEEASLKKLGFIVFTVQDEFLTEEENIAGVSRWFPSGTYKDIPITFFLSGIPQQAVQNSQGDIYLMALMFYDNGNQKFDKKEDTLVRNIFNEPVVARFKVLGISSSQVPEPER